MDENIENSRYIKNLEKHIEDTKTNIKYSLDRFDILIITLSSGGLVFSMGFIKDIIQEGSITHLLLLKLAWILFGSAIISNLLSQVTGYYANKNEIKISKNIIREKRGKELQGNQAKLKSNHKITNSSTNFLNGASLFLLIGAVILLIIFMSINLK